MTLKSHGLNEFECYTLRRWIPFVEFTPICRSIRRADLPHGDVCSALWRCHIRLEWLPCPPLAGQRRRLTIEIIGGGADQIPITIVPFGAEERLSQPLSPVIAADLARSGCLRLQPVGSAPPSHRAGRGRLWLLEESGQPDHDRTYRGAQRRQGRRALPPHRCHQEAQLLGFSYTVAKAQTRATAHKIADLIYEKLTGERGVFSTRIAYVARNPNRFELRCRCRRLQLAVHPGTS